jgi:hypothetical protein
MKGLITSFALSLLVSCALKPQRQEVKAASAESTAEVARPTLTQQKLCAEQAKKAFDEGQQQARQLGGDSPISDYTSHFDPQKNVCYVRVSAVTASKRGVTNSVVVYDAFERRIFANFLWVNYSQKKYWEVKPSECEVHPPQLSTIHCQSSDEFNDLVEKWFGVAQ